MIYSRRYAKKALEEKNEELVKLTGENRVKLEEKIIKESQSEEVKEEEIKKEKKKK